MQNRRPGSRRAKLSSAFGLILLLSLISARVGSVGAATIVTTTEWDNIMSHTPTPGQGCWQATYPNTAWGDVPCSNETAPLTTVGHGAGDNIAKSGSTVTQWAQGTFTSVSGITHEGSTYPNGSPPCGSGYPYYCSGYHTFQINSQYFTCTPNGTTNIHSTKCWEQFVFYNSPASGSNSEVYIEYWLLNYATSSTGQCPSGGSQPYHTWVELLNGSANPARWDCEAYTQVTTLGNQGDSNSALYSLYFTGESNEGSSGNDESDICNGSNCYANTATDVYLQLYNSWTTTEFNIFGGGAGSQAGFNSATQLTVGVWLEDGNSNLITPSCGSGSTTAETNNLTLGSCTARSPPDPNISFPEDG